jgi:hypothetical protein
MTLRFPNDTQRHAIVGTTGSGKTTFGLWCLARRDFDRKPWIIIDAKRDPMIKAIPGLEEIRIDRTPPTRRGLHAVRPMPGDFDDGVCTSFLYRVWENEHTGLFIDEGYAFKQFDRGLRTVLTQGRSRHVPIISLSQKPSWVSPFLFSESEFKSVFYLDQPSDIDRVMAWLPERDPNTGERIRPDLLDDHHSYWCHRRKEFGRLAPCDPEEVIMQQFEDRKVRRVWV